MKRPPTSFDIPRRDLLIGAGALACALLTPGGTAMADPAPSSPSPRPLPFDPSRLRGLSERLLRSHHENNYGGAVKNLAAVRAELAKLPPDAPGFVRAGLKRNELLFRNSVVLHEAYFGNLGGDGNAAGDVHAALATAWGDFGAWEADFRSTAMSLAGGSGWALLVYDLHQGAPAVSWSWDHAHAPIGGIPLLALDMYEHSYHLDFGAAAARYVDAFMENVDWQVVDRRYQAARAADATLGEMR